MTDGDYAPLSRAERAVVTANTYAASLLYLSRTRKQNTAHQCHIMRSPDSALGTTTTSNSNVVVVTRSK
jgi:hypothetical protein